MEKYKYILISLSVSAFFLGCQKNEGEIRHYTEVVVVPKPTKPADHPHTGAAPHGDMPHADMASSGSSMKGMESMVPPADSSPLRWEAPEGWGEQAGSGMRMATFTVSSDAGSAETTIVSLGGNAGGLQSNIGRWLGQLGVEDPDEAKLTAFVSGMPTIETVEGKALSYGNLGSWTSGDGSQDSMRAGIISAHGRTVFIKMTGPEALLAAEDAEFQSLCRSIRFHAEGEGH